MCQAIKKDNAKLLGMEFQCNIILNFESNQIFFTKRICLIISQDFIKFNLDLTQKLDLLGQNLVFQHH